MSNFYKNLADKFQEISEEDIEFIDKSFKLHGKVQDASFGNYSIGLEELNKQASITIEKNTGNYYVSLVDRKNHWDFSVTIDGKTGKWENPVQGIIKLSDFQA